MANMITITFNPETTAQANVVAQAMFKYLEISTDSTPAVVEQTTAAEVVDTEKPKKLKAAKPAAPAAETVTEKPAPAATESAPAATASEPTVTLEQVRAKLAALSQAGKAPAVKDLLKKFGAAKLTDVAAETYAELLAAAEEL